MHFEQSEEGGKSPIKKPPNFQKDVIIPNIYDIKNFELIAQEAYPPKIERKAYAAKKMRVQAVVETILTKKTIAPSKKQPMHVHRLSRPQTAPARKKYPNSPQFDIAQENLLMNVDEKINEMAVNLHEQSLVDAQKHQKFHEKIEGAMTAEKNTPLKEETNFYLTELSPRKMESLPVKVQSLSQIGPKPVKGWVQEMEEKERKRQIRNRRELVNQVMVRTRPQSSKGVKRIESASLIKSNRSELFTEPRSLFNGKLSRYERGSDLHENIKLESKNERQKDRFSHLLKIIESRCLQNGISKNEMVCKMNKLGLVWKTQKEFLNPEPTNGSGLPDEVLSSIKMQRASFTRSSNN